MNPPRTTLCPGYSHVTTFSPELSSPKSKSISVPAGLGPTGGDDDSATTVGEIQDGEGSESEYEEEIEYVTLDLGNIEPTLVPSSHTYRLIGLDTPTPYLQLSGMILQGLHEDLLGSELIFTDDKSESADRAKKKSVTHVATTSKRISFKEVRLRPKKERKSDASGDRAELWTDDAERDSSRMGTMGGEDEPAGAEEDDALEYVDLPMSISAMPTTPIDPSPSILHALNEEEDNPISTTSRNIDKGKQRANEPPFPAVLTAEEVEETGDPAMQIDRLTGISPPIVRVPRKRKAAGSNKGKQKAGDDQMDMTEG